MIEIRCTYDEMVPIGELLPHPDNPHQHDDEQIDNLCILFQYFGVRHPAIISKLSGLLTNSHARVLAATKCGMETYPVVYQDFADKDEEIAWLIADNTSTDWGTLSMAQVNRLVVDFKPTFDIKRFAIKGFVLDPSEKQNKKKKTYQCPSCGESGELAKFQSANQNMI